MTHIAHVWMALVAEYRAARVAQEILRDKSKSQADRDLATVDYGRRCDLIVTLLDELSEQSALSRVASLLRRAA